MATQKILLIDDDALVLKSFKMLLNREGYEIIEASSYGEALNAISTRSFDLIVSDIRMPGKDGVATVTEIQNSLRSAGKKELPIIFITGYAEYGQEHHAEFLGETLFKPVDNAKLLRTIRDYL